MGSDEENEVSERSEDRGQLHQVEGHHVQAEHGQQLIAALQDEDVRNNTIATAEDGIDEEVTFSLTCEEIPGKRKGSFMYKTTDDHLWRINRKQSETKRFMYCYHSNLTVDARVKKVCNARGIMDMTTKRIVMNKPHNHEPDRELLDVLKLRHRVLTAAESSNVKLSHVFNDATRGQEGACRVGFHPMSRCT